MKISQPFVQVTLHNPEKHGYQQLQTWINLLTVERFEEMPHNTTLLHFGSGQQLYVKNNILELMRMDQTDWSNLDDTHRLLKELVQALAHPQL